MARNAHAGRFTGQLITPAIIRLGSSCIKISSDFTKINHSQEVKISNCTSFLTQHKTKEKDKRKGPVDTVATNVETSKISVLRRKQPLMTVGFELFFKSTALQIMMICT